MLSVVNNIICWVKRINEPKFQVKDKVRVMIFNSKRPPKITTATVKRVLAKENYTVPEDWEYRNSHYKMPFTCDKGHSHMTTWNAWRGGVRCRSCSYEKIHGKPYNSSLE